jgi:DNA (cytosine-5)-methyltransferase 1
MSQISFFDGSQPLKITKPIRLIECFAGYGSQALALKYLGVEFEHWKIAEWAVKSIQAYKDMHFADDDTDYSEGKSKEWLIDYLFARGISADYNKPMTREQISRMGESKIRTVYNNIIATHNLVSVCNVNGEDLEITDTDKYTYVLTYSFPCQDLSQAGLSKGMQKGSGTRSGLLWEIERMLDECDELPQILLMENVPQVIGEKNRDAFRDWFCKLESLGYKSWYAIMNGKDYEIPQNRDRCFMVSALGDHYYEFPTPNPLKLRLKDLLEDEVDEKYYLSDKTIEMLIKHTEKKQAQGCGFKFEPTDGNGVGKCISTRAGARTEDNFIKEYSIIKPAHGYFCGSVENTDIISTIDTGVGNWHTLIGEAKCGQDINIAVKSAVKDGYEIAEIGDSIDIAYPNSDTRRGRVGKGVSQTLLTSDQMAVITEEVRVFDYYNKKEIDADCCGVLTTGTAHNESGTFFVGEPQKRIRKLTPKECFRLMGVKDVDFERVSKNQSDSSLYHLAGDSIITNCLMAILKQML